MENLQDLLATVTRGLASAEKEVDGPLSKKRSARARSREDVESGAIPADDPSLAEWHEDFPGNPLKDDILTKELSASFRPIHYEYSWTTDPSKHVFRFNNTTSLHRLSDGMKCRVFATTLTGPAQIWYNSLPNSSIRGFAQLSSVFLRHFASSKKHRNNALTLFAIKKKEGEPLRQFIKRFNSATLEVTVTSEVVLISALAQGLRMGNLFHSLSKKPPASYSDLLQRAEKYVNTEEAQKEKFSETRTVMDARREGRRERSNEKEPPPTRVERKGGSRYETYKPLAVPPSEILMAITNNPKLKWPRTYSEVPKRHPSIGVFCRFHNDYEHTTDDCQHLRDEIERLIRARNLSEFVKEEPRLGDRSLSRGQVGPAAKQSDQRQGKQPAGQAGSFISMIHGGTSCGDSNRARRAHLRALREIQEEIEEINMVHYSPVIIFGEGDERGIQQPQDDALVITAMVANYDVARILVDTGSSSDIIYMDCFRQMDIDAELGLVATSLVGFTGDSVRPIGEVYLPLSLGREPL